MSVLVTGGAGYIGSHMVYGLVDRGESVIVLDNLSTGNRSLVSERAVLVEGEVADASLVKQLVKDHSIDAVIHFAGSIIVPESVEKPLAYYANNTMASCVLMDTCISNGVRNFIFSSTAAVYSSDARQPLSEDQPTRPISPYARSKLMTEWMLEDASRAHDFAYAVLRYFNVAGADPKGRTGQSSPRATHLIKRAAQVALGRVPHLDIFGTDYPTRDGTGIRDYIHVTDLVEAHLLTLDALRSGTRRATYNCGYGHGTSVREVVDTVERVIGRRLLVKEGPRRAGDPPMLVADPSRIKNVLNWQPRYDDLAELVRSALDWERRFNS
jgi:UDP-glucose 4-epimerase